MEEEKIKGDIVCGKSESVVKAWEFSTKTGEKAGIKKQSVALTNKRLILSESVGEESYRRFSYRVDEIKSVNYRVRQQIKTPLSGAVCMVFAMILTVIGIVFLSSHSTSYSYTVNGQIEAVSSNSNQTAGIVVLLVGIVLLAVAIYILIKNKIFIKQVAVYVETSPTHTHKIIDGVSDTMVTFNSVGALKDELTLMVDDEVIAMVNELDNLIVDIQSGVKIKKESKGE